MSVKAVARDRFERQGVQILVGETGPGGAITRVFSWGPGEIRVLNPSDGYIEESPDDGVFFPEDVARAVYEALADHFGHSGHDTRTLRRDYEAERKRVDTFIAHMTGVAS